MEPIFEEQITGKAYDFKLIARLFTFIRPYIFYLVLSIIFLFLVTLIDILPPYVLKIAIDNYILQNKINEIYKIILLYMSLFVLHFIFYFLHSYTINLMAQKAMLDLRIKVFSHLQSLSYSFYDKNPIGRIITRVIGDIETLNDLLSAGVVTILGDLLTIFWIIVMLFILNFELALLTIAIIPFIVIATIIYRRYARESYRKARVIISALNAYFQEHVAGMLEVQNFTNEKESFKKFDELNYKNFSTYKQTIRQNAIFFPTVELINQIAIALIIYYGSSKVMNDVIGFGVLVAYTQYINRFFKPIRDLAEKYNIFQMAMASCEKIFALLDLKPEITDLSNNKNNSMSLQLNGNIKFENVVFEYNKGDEILHGISFEIKANESVAIVGQTGSGKTTIINLIGRFYDIKSGKITIDGIDIKDIPLKTLRSQIAIMQQDIFLFSGSIEKNIRMNDPKFTFDDVQKAAKAVYLDEIVEKLPLKYNQPVGERGITLSQGERQLLALARIMLFNPKIIILDEATSYIDTKTELLIRNALKEVLKNRTSIIIAHRLSTIKNVDKIIVLHKGKIVEIGTHEELLNKKGVYHKLYELQFQDQENNTTSS